MGDAELAVHEPSLAQWGASRRGVAPVRRLWVAVAAVVLVCAGVVAGVVLDRTALHRGTATTVPAPSGTTVEVFAPWTEAGALAPGIRVLGHLDGGTCWTTSIADSADPDAWRCMVPASHELYDPCFAPPQGMNLTEVACAASPWSGVYLLHLAHPLPHATSTTTPTPSGEPWYLELANGQRCGLITGTAGEESGVYLNYSCQGGSASVPDTRAQPWTVRYLAVRSHAIVRVAVTTGWH